MEGWVALPLVENESNATRGRMSEHCRASCAVETAMSASWSTVGSGMTPQSAMNRTPFSPKRVSSTSMTMQLEAVVVVRRHFDDLKQRPQHAAGDLRSCRKPGRPPGASRPSWRRNNSAAAWLRALPATLQALSRGAAIQSAAQNYPDLRFPPD